MFHQQRQSVRRAACGSLPACARARRRRAPRVPAISDEPGVENAAERRALVLAHPGKAFERGIEAGDRRSLGGAPLVLAVPARSATSITPLIARMPSSRGGSASTWPGQPLERFEHGFQHRFVDPHHRHHAGALDHQRRLQRAARHRLRGSRAHLRFDAHPSPAAVAAADRGPWN